jgi:uracil-DNA glycosylase
MTDDPAVQTAERSQIKLHPEWLEALAGEFDKGYMRELKNFLMTRKKAGAVVYPPGSEIFNALDSTPLSEVKVVILGQDPYHGPGQAHGLCFSVREGVQPPPSLLNIFRELQSDLGLSPPTHGHLQSWADQGVLLLNAVLTVERGQAGAHQGKGWETFTDAVVATVNAQCEHVVFLLWGAQAQRKGAGIDSARHKVLKAPHPSPLSAHRGFFGCRHFSQTNAWLTGHGIAPVNWALPAQRSDARLA